MNTPREVAHGILAPSFECNFGWVHQGITIDLHSMACDRATAAIEARDAEHAAEVARWLDTFRSVPGRVLAVHLRDGTWRGDLARLDAAASAVVPAETPATAWCVTCGKETCPGCSVSPTPAQSAVTPVPEEVPREVPPPNLNDVVRWLDGEAAKYRAASDRAQDDGLKNESLRCTNWMHEIECLARAFRDGSWLADVAQLAPATQPTPSAPPREGK